MSEKEYNIPETYEEAVLRKQELLEKINSYNEALLLEKELPCSEEEIEELQEEFQFLNDHLALTKEEKLQKLSENDVVVNEDGTIEEKNTIFDKIHWFVYLYAFISTIFAGGIITKLIGNNSMESFIDKYCAKVYDAGVGMFDLGKSGMMMGGFEFWFNFCLSYLWLPIAIILLSTVVYFIFRRKKDINRKVTFWLLMLHIVLAVVVSVIVIFVGENSEFNYWKDVWENLEDYYAVYHYVTSNSAGY